MKLFANIYEALLKRKIFKKRHIKLLINTTLMRIDTIKTRQSVMVKDLRTDIAELLKSGQNSDALERVGRLYFCEKMLLSYDFVARYCILVSNQVKAMNDRCSDEGKEAVSSLMYAAAQFWDLPELRELRNLFFRKFENSLVSFIDKEFLDVLKLRSQTKEMKIQVMQEIAEEYGVEWYYDDDISSGTKSEVSTSQDTSASPEECSTSFNCSSEDDDKKNVDVPNDDDAAAQMVQLSDYSDSVVELEKETAKEAQDEVAKLMNENEQLKSLLERKSKEAEEEVESLREEHHQRVSTLERKVSALTEERDTLRIEQNKKSDSTAIALLKEKDEIITQVMAQGEELSKKQADQECTIRKLREQLLRARLREFKEVKKELTTKLQVEERDKAATEKKLLQETIQKNNAELATQKDYYTSVFNAAKFVRNELEIRLKEAEEREATLVQTVEELKQTLSRKEQQAVFREDMLRRDIKKTSGNARRALLRVIWDSIIVPKMKTLVSASVKSVKKANMQLINHILQLQNLYRCQNSNVNV